jgi:LacI family transcriptional regulator
VTTLTRPSRVTLHHVAARAGVSIATVSRALNGLPVAPDNQQRVEKAAAELGYVPNEAARSLRSDRTLTLGLIFFQLGPNRGVDLLDEIGATVEQGGYSLLISTARGDPNNYSILMRRFLERRVDGLFCSMPHGDAGLVARYQAAHVPVLALTYAGPGFRELPIVRASFDLESDPGVQHLLREGHRKAAWIDDAEPLTAAAAMGTAWKASPLETEIIPLPETGGMDMVVRDFLARPDRPTVIVGPEHHASAFLAACRIIGVSVPGDFSVVAITNGESERRAVRQEMASTMIDSALIGRRAGETMLAWLAGEPPEPSIDLVITRWNPRSTVGPVKS